jgi:putative addiction module component (TIGR02574 family)
MSPSGKQLLKDALQLPQEERAALAGELLDSLDPTSPSQRRSEQEWLAELQRRAQEAISGKPGLTWGETIQRVTDRLAQQ